MNRRTCVPNWRRARTDCLSSILVTLALASTCAQAASSDQAAKPSQTWRCTSPSGLVSYSQQACTAGGELVTLKDARTHGQQRQAKDNNERDVKLARQMMRERRHEERMAAKEDAISLSGNGKPHVIHSTPNTHAPVPISDMTRPIRIKPNKKAAPSSTQPSNGGTGTRAL